jgi:crotonobetainyl-CoA:carnitine CoA-transferase CaiB-like acyl-CoA transferase
VEWTVQARSGLTASYIPDSADPRDPGLGVLDIGSGQAAVTAILAALLQRAATGAGQRIDVAMLDVAMNLSCTRINSAATKRRLRPAVGRFRAADRAIFLMGAHQRWFRTLCSVLGPPDLGEDPRFADEAAREANANALLDELNARLAARPAAEWEALFLQAGLPAAVVRSLQEVLDSTAIRQRGQVLPGRVSGSERSIRVVAPPFKLPEQARPLPAPVPAIGEHTDAVLQRLGFAADEIAAFRAEGLV